MWVKCKLESIYRYDFWGQRCTCGCVAIASTVPLSLALRILHITSLTMTKRTYAHIKLINKNTQERFLHRVWKTAFVLVSPAFISPSGGSLWFPLREWPLISEGNLTGKVNYPRVSPDPPTSLWRQEGSLQASFGDISLLSTKGQPRNLSGPTRPFQASGLRPASEKYKWWGKWKC